jgi:hypothetical protein
MPHTPSFDWRERLGRQALGALRPFWHAYPPQSPVSIFLLDIRGAMSPTEGFFYNRIPKAANSTVMRRLTEVSTYRRPFVQHEKDRFLRPSFLSRARVAEIVAGRTFCFTVVRDPYARVLSAYRDKVLQGRPQGVRHFGPDVRQSPPDFTTFCRFLEQGGLYLDAHWAPQTDLMVLPLHRFDLIGRVETLSTDLDTITRRIWNTPTLMPDRVGNVTEAERRISADYTPEARAIVARLYASDFAAFGYQV